MSDRRGFLRGLASLPLIGGGVALIGQPSAVAERLSVELLSNYNQWLWGEHGRCARELEERFGLTDARFTHVRNAGAAFHTYANRRDFAGGGWTEWNWNPDQRPASDRAALVLSAVGVDWRVAW